MKLPRLVSGADSGHSHSIHVRRWALCRRWGWGCRRQGGATLPIVLVLTAMLQVLALAQADTALIALRTAGARRDRLIALVAADSGLVLCARLLAQGAAPVLPWTGPGEPAYWRSGQAFSGPAPAAFALFATGASSGSSLRSSSGGGARGISAQGPGAANGSAAWPGTAGPLLCLIESRSTGPQAQAYLLTVRGRGAHLGTQSYLQRMEFDPDPAGKSGPGPQVLGWRNVAAAPNG
jgi:hypothetical protein